MSVSRSLSLIAAAIVLASAPAAFAAPAPASKDAASINAGLQAMRDYNLIVLKDLTSTSQVQGKTFVGGNLSGSSSNYATNPGAQAGGTALTVGGAITGGAKNINNGGGIKVGGALESGANMNGGGGVQAGGNVKSVNANGASVYSNGNVTNTNAKDIYYGGTIASSNGTKHAGDHTTSTLKAAIDAQTASLSADVLATSDYFSDLATTNMISYSGDGQQAIFNAGTGTGVAVFSITDLNAALKNRSQLIFNMPTGYDAVIVNVAGTSVSLPSSINFNGPTGLGAKVIWNFYEATTVDLGSKSWYGSVLAPQAQLKNGNFIEGSVIVASMIQNGEIKMNGFGGSNLIVSQFGGAAPIPEPAVWTMMILGFGAIGTVLRRRRALAL
ncbi:MAG: choice-of-anchor A family protein [Alphaproteobacteria bacterium]|nr:choice-of-anchor A family protein [Alphaproteobacteria bacterium]MBU1515127.1 choice-of-anchor A family protein [Alphaproteobacteria bacterium]MBU2093485.1 choice-of-anchor A family protein [Alphaproteobacteria bacterium]MBU2152333.1 choice-of-anchor A family protein [Alphaproteobacteria bacterium]MBU2308147.1 choice-of-anchor A family protein [Alphaproteobacteria bacterium]